MKNLIPYLCIFLFLSSCEDVIDLEVPSIESKLVVEGFITDRPGTQTIKLTESQDFFEDTDAPSLSGAVVTLTDDQGRNETLIENPEGSGLYTTDQAGIHGRSYVLNIDLPDGRTYRSEPEVLNSTPTLDSIYARFAGVDDNDVDEYNLFFDATDPQAEINFYRWRVFVNDTLLDDPIDLFLSDDRFIAGPITENELILDSDKYLKVGDRALVEMQSISGGHFDFLQGLFQQTALTGPFANPPASVKSNLINMENPEDRALGYFAAIGIDRKEMVVEEKKHHKQSLLSRSS